MFGYLGNPDDVAKKGIAGPVTLFKSSSEFAPIPITKWKWKVSTGGEETASEVIGSDTDGGDWKEVQASQDLFNGKPGYGWLEANFNPGPSGRHILHLMKMMFGRSGSA